MSQIPPSPRAPPGKRLNPIPVGLKEAALDSPTFRATASHFAEQVELLEKWLEDYLKCTSRLIGEAASLENALGSFISHALLPNTISEAVVDHDYSVLALKKHGEGAREFWMSTVAVIKKLSSTAVEPLRSFLLNDLRTFKDTRRSLEIAQKNFDSLQAKYVSHAKSKEPSSLREDAFQLHEARKSYLRLSMEYCVLAPQLRSAIDKLLIRVFCDQWREMRSARDNNAATLSRGSQEMDRVYGWVREMEDNERTFNQELVSARKQLEDAAEAANRPSRELEDYSISPAPHKGHQTSGVENVIRSPRKEGIKRAEKQGWLYLRTYSGKPARTVWIRRWAFVKHGIFGWLLQANRSGGVEESERIGVLMCNVRSAVQEERRFCFEMKTKSHAIMLQADTQAELTEWIGVIENAKSKALEEPGSVESSVSKIGHLDPAFAISPPSVPEFGTTVLDSTSPGSKDDESSGLERSSTSPTMGQEVDTGRKGNGTGFEGGGLRDHAARAISRVDLPRKTSGQATGGVPASPAAGGIASLIASSHGSMPVGPGAPVKMGDTEKPKISFSLAPRDMPPNTLAPSTLINPPAPTQLSKQAVVISGDRGVGSLADKNGGMPGGLLANVWGSSNWAYVNRLERGELKESVESKPFEQPSPLLLASGPANQAQSSGVIKENLAPLSSSFTDLSIPDGRSTARASSPPRRSTLSMDTQRAEVLRRAVAPQEYPVHYPLQLKTQSAQFRLLFPCVSREEKVVLVFRATWNPNDQQEFPGRAYVTTREIYFFSHHLGLVLASGVRLSNIDEVTAGAGRDCDFLFLHLRESKDESSPARITIKTFLEPLRLLQKRLNYLARNSVADEPADLDEVVRTLIRMEAHGPRRRSSSDSWEDVPITTPIDNGTANGRSHSLQSRNHTKNSIRVDGSLASLESQPDRHGRGRRDSKFRLPAQPVIYRPVGNLHQAVEKTFDVSPKALFHVLFGDKSAVWQLLQHEHRATHLKQGPWASIGQGHLRRDLEFEIPIRRSFGGSKMVKVHDYQVVDVLNDHLCYVVTDKRTAWHLPYRRSFKVVSKIVITHMAKSKSKLAIFTKVEWIRSPWVRILKGVVDRRAMDDLELDALDLTDLVSDQIRRLGAYTRTKKATQIFGQVGHSDASIECQMQKTAINIEMRRVPVQRTLFELLLQTTGSLLESVITSLIGALIDVCRWGWKTCSANGLILALLLLSGLFNSYYGARDSWSWWHERNAHHFLARMGVQPNTVMSKAIYVHDLDLALVNGPDDFVSSPEQEEKQKQQAQNHTFPSSTPSPQQDRPCYITFQQTYLSDLTAPSPPPPPPPPPPSPSSTHHRLSGSSFSALDNYHAHRLHTTRHNLALHRHDLLVALRMLNSMDRELVRAEWENWLVAENRRCGVLAEVFKGRNDDDDDDDGDEEEEEEEEGREGDLDDGGDGKEPGLGSGLGDQAKRWYEEYCESCRLEKDGLDSVHGGLV